MLLPLQQWQRRACTGTVREEGSGSSPPPPPTMHRTVHSSTAQVAFLLPDEPARSLLASPTGSEEATHSVEERTLCLVAAASKDQPPSRAFFHCSGLFAAGWTGKDLSLQSTQQQRGQGLARSGPLWAGAGKE